MNPNKMQKKCLEVSTMMKALSHPERLMIMCHLSEGEKNVSEIFDLCDISQSQLSQFLNRMQREKLLKIKKEGNFVYYSVADKKMIAIIQSLQKIFCA